MSFAVLATPHVVLRPLATTVYSGNPFKLTCEAHVPDTGHPDIPKGVSFHWTKNGTDVVDGGGGFLWYSLNN